VKYAALNTALSLKTATDSSDTKSVIHPTKNLTSLTSFGG
jgi:hypothetical protein